MKQSTNLYRKVVKDVKREILNGKGEEYAYINVYDNLLNRYLSMLEIGNYFSETAVIPV